VIFKSESVNELIDVNAHLHSNLVIFKFKKLSSAMDGAKTFTFQSGDIQINKFVYCDTLCLLFTFQSGDIQMCNMKQLKNILPCNLHSNLVIFKYGLAASGASLIANLHSNLVIFKYVNILLIFIFFNLFTFQSGDIQIHTFGFMYDFVDSYDLHSNLVIFKLITKMVFNSST